MLQAGGSPSGFSPPPFHTQTWHIDPPSSFPYLAQVPNIGITDTLGGWSFPEASPPPSICGSPNCSQTSPNVPWAGTGGKIIPS